VSDALEWVNLVLSGLAGAGVVVLVLLRVRRGEDAARMESPAAPDEPAPPVSTARPTAELVGAWVHFLRDHVRDAVGGLNNRLSAISLEVETLRRGGLADDHRETVEHIALEVERASNITAALMSRVSSDAPDSPPQAWRILRDAPNRPARVLVVESDESNRVAIARLLRSIGHRVNTATDGWEAWEILNKETLDCILCDPRLPTIGGRALYEQVGEQLPQLSRRFVFVTGDLTDPAIHAFLEASGQPVIGKPYELEDLLQAIATILEQAGVVGSA
jgi:CheY-like chemotaxis protein